MSQYAIIRVWKEASQKYGHTSVELFKDGVNTYVSLYPITKVGDLNWQGVKYKTRSLAEDLKKYENIDPNPFEYRLKGLNIQEMQDEYQKLVETGFNFSMLGSTILKHPETHNCSGLVFHLFKVGGGDNLLGFYERMWLKMRTTAPSGAKVLGYASFPLAVVGLWVAWKAMGTRQTIAQDVMIKHVFKVFDPYGKERGRTQFITPHNVGPFLPDPLAQTFKDPIATSPHSEIRRIVNNTVGQFSQFLSDFPLKMGKVGYVLLGLSTIISLISIGYVSFAGLGSVTSFSVITPTDIANIADHIVKREKNSQSSILSTIGHTLLAPLPTRVRHALEAVVNTAHSTFFLQPQ